MKKGKLKIKWEKVKWENVFVIYYTLTAMPFMLGVKVSDMLIQFAMCYVVKVLIKELRLCYKEEKEEEVTKDER